MLVFEGWGLQIALFIEPFFCVPHIPQAANYPTLLACSYPWAFLLFTSVSLHGLPKYMLQLRKNVPFSDCCFVSCLLLVSSGAAEHQPGRSVDFSTSARVDLALVPKKQPSCLLFADQPLFHREQIQYIKLGIFLSCLTKQNKWMFSISCSKYFWEAFGQLLRSIPSSAKFTGEKKGKDKERKEMHQLKENCFVWNVWDEGRIFKIYLYISYLSFSLGF